MIKVDKWSPKFMKKDLLIDSSSQSNQKCLKSLEANNFATKIAKKL